MGQAGGGHRSRGSAGDPSATPRFFATPSGLATAAICVTLMLAAPALAAPLDKVLMMPASGLDFEAGFRMRPEPTFTQSNIRMLFEAPAMAGGLAAAVAPSEPFFARPEVAALFADRTATLTGGLAEPADAAREPVFMQADVAALFAGGEALASEESAEPAAALPTFMRAEFADLLAAPAEASAGDAPPEPTTALPTFAQPQVAALFQDPVMPLAAETAEIRVPAPAFLQPDATALFFARFDELAADLPDAPSPKALQTVSLHGPIAPPPAANDGPAATGSLAARDGPPDGASGTATGSIAKPRRIGGGRAVWYEHPGRTASGEVFDPDGMTAGHRTLPLGTRVKVVNLQNGRSVVVRINDRGPVQKKFEIDLSRGSARVLGFTGVAPIEMYAVD